MNELFETIDRLKRQIENLEENLKYFADKRGFNQHWKSLEMSERAKNCINQYNCADYRQRLNLIEVQTIADLYKIGKRKLFKIPYMGLKSMDSIQEALQKKGFPTLK